MLHSRAALVLTLAMGGMLAGLAAPARADQSRLIGDWTATCWTQQNRCATETDADQRSGSGRFGIALSFSRNDGPNTGWEVGFRVSDVEPADGSDLAFTLDDGAEIRFSAGGYALTKSGHFIELTDGGKVARLFEALRSGGRVTVAFTGAGRGPAEAGFSLRGLDSALSWLDAVQSRAGVPPQFAAAEITQEPETAAEAPPAEPPSEMVETPPAEPPAEMAEPAPEIAAEDPAPKTVAETPPAEPEAPAAKPSEMAEKPMPETEGPEQMAPGPPPNIPPAILAKHVAKSECEPLEVGLLDSRLTSAAALSENKMLYVIPCFAGAYNIAYRLYVVRNDDVGTMRTLYFANYSRSLGWYGSDTLINVSYEPETGILRAFGKGRGLGDCGNAAVYRWAAFDFKMIEYRAWDRCDGSRQPERWPVIYKSND